MATEAEHRFLQDHVWGLLATGRSDGSPQVSMVAYDWDGIDVVISTRAHAAKFINASRRGSVVFCVPDGHDNLTITGEAVCHATGPDRDRLTQRLSDLLAVNTGWAADLLEADIDAGLDAVDRVIIQITPARIELNQPRG